MRRAVEELVRMQKQLLHHLPQQSQPRSEPQLQRRQQNVLLSSVPAVKPKMTSEQVCRI
jgi:hypothetical protein